MMNTDALSRVKEILKEGMTEQEIEEIAAVMEEVEGKLQLEEKEHGFWESKTACWEMFSCPPQIKNECPAFLYGNQPCWEMEGTYCKLTAGGSRGDSTEICETCRIYKKYGHGEPVHITLWGQGLTAV